MTLALLAKTAEEAAHHGPPAWVFGVVTFGLLLSLLAVTFAFKSVGTRHD